MRRRIRRRSVKAGLPPGTLVHIGEQRTEKARITVTEYDKAHFREEEVTAIETCFPFRDPPTVTWLNIDGVHQVEVVENVGQHLSLHPLLVEDVVNTEQRPKLEDYGDYVFIVLRMLDYDETERDIQAEQVSLVLGSNFVVSFQEGREGDVFGPVRERISNGKGRIRKMGADYLAYSLIDAVVDNYFIILEKLGEEIEDIEEELVTHPTSDTLQAIHKLKREMIFLRKSLWPLREVVSSLERGESPLVQESTGVYLRDVYDHTIQVIDTLETFRDVLSGMLDMYLSSISNRMNEVMKVLTIFATIFIPLTFIAGVYGMNFKYMPELDWRWGYPALWLIMLVVGGLMLMYFRSKRWL